MARVAVFTLGCKVNQAESEELKMALEAAGHVLASDPADADLCIVNTCAVTAESERKCRKLIRWLHRKGASSVVAAGCYAQVDPESLERLPGVALVLPNRRKDGWLTEIEDLLPAGEACGPTHTDQRARGLVKVQDGCQRGCTYCIVPQARGPERSRAPAEVMEAVSRWREKGCREIVLCGVNLGRYAWGEGYDLAALVRDVLSVDGGFRLRLSSLELEDLRPEWVEEWSGERRVCPHLHLPLQSGDARLLREMGRGYGPGDYLEAAGMLRRLWPQAALTTEVIVGYPGEDERAFLNTVEVLREAGVSRVHVFRFSPRPGTRDWEKRELVDAEAAEERSRRLRALAEDWRREYALRHLGERRELLVERGRRGEEERFIPGTTEDYIKALMAVPEEGVDQGEMVTVSIRGWKDGRAEVSRIGPEGSFGRHERDDGTGKGK